LKRRGKGQIDSGGEIRAKRKGREQGKFKQEKTGRGQEGKIKKI
jgi:hypothetical protein